MSVEMHPAAPHHLPFFITAPGQSDALMFVVGVMLIGGLIAVGVFYLYLHALPEHVAHKGQKAQYQIVAILGLLALFTHNHLFWIAALLLAFIQLPDVTGPLGSISRSLEALVGRPLPGEAPPPPRLPPPAPRAEGPEPGEA